MNNFAAYKLPAGLAGGVDIPLDGTDAVITVKLPSMMDETLQLKIISRVNTNENGTIDSVSLQLARREVFFDDCILGAKGLPDDMDPADFFEEYPLAARAIFNQASNLALEADQEVNDALGKLKPTQNGKSSGQAKRRSTKK